MKRILLTILVLGILAAGGGLLCMYLGVYNVAAVAQHTRPVYWMLENGMKYSVRRRAAGIRVPPLDDESMRAKGFYHYRQHCERCHGGPGVAPEDFAKGMTPAPLNLVQVSRLWSPAELYWSTKYGLKPTGMPAFEYRLNEKQLWELVAFLRELASISPQEYRRWSETAVPDRSEIPTPENARMDK